MNIPNLLVFPKCSWENPPFSLATPIASLRKRKSRREVPIWGRSSIIAGVISDYIHCITYLYNIMICYIYISIHNIYIMYIYNVYNIYIYIYIYNVYI